MLANRIPHLAVLALLAATPLTAQQSSSSAIVVSGRGGGFTALANLNDLGTSDFKTGWSVGGGVAVQLSKFVVVRSDFTYARDEFRINGTGTGEHLQKYFYGGAIQLQYPFAGGFTPYVLAGGGGVTLKPINTATKSKGQGTFGAGFSYAIPGSAVSVFTEGVGYVYKPNGVGGSLTGVNRTQFDLAWTGGVSYRFHL